MAESPSGQQAQLAGQTVVVLGGSSGMGLETARLARASGAEVVITGRNEGRLKQAADEVGATRTAAFDALDESALGRFFGQFDGPIGHVLVTAGGPYYYESFGQLDVADGMKYVTGHLAAPINVARYASPRMGPGGSLTFIGGTGARRPGKGMSIIAAATAGITALVPNLALEVAPVRVNAIAPGFVDTGLSASLLADELDARRAELRRTLPVQRVTEPSDVAALAIAIMTNPALTGATYDIDGGQQLLLWEIITEVSDTASALPRWQGKTLWARDRAAPLREFLRTEAASALVLVTGIVVALVWANVSDASYESFWHTRFYLGVGSAGIDQDLRDWLNSGLMTLFFLVVGLETRRELDLGDLRERRRFVLPVVTGLTGMAIPVAIYLAFNAGGPGEHGWGVAMSTDTALALGLLALFGREVPDRMRVFVLTVFVVDDLGALLVIAFVYSDKIVLMPLVVAVIAFAVMVVAVRFRFQRRSVFVVLGVVVWAALRASGVDPVVAGLAIGLAAPAYSPARTELEDATGLVRQFREQPTPELARTAKQGLTATLSPNSRLQSLYLPWTSYLIVPLFALANAGVVLSGSFLAHAYTAPITLGVLVGYAAGKPVAVTVSSWAVTKLSHGKIRPPIGNAAVLGSGTIAGIGFTAALLIATRAFTGQNLAEAKLGALSAVVVAAGLTWGVLRVTQLLPAQRRARLLLGDTRLIQDLIPAVDPDQDHIRGPKQALITVIEFGDFECPYCGQAEPVVRDILTDTSIRYVWRHLPLTDVHHRAQLAAEAAEAAAAQDGFWPMHDLLLQHQDALSNDDLLGYAESLGLDVARFGDDLDRHTYMTRVAQDVESADLSGVSGTPTFFINGQRHYGAFDLATLTAAIRTARERALTGTAPDWAPDEVDPDDFAEDRA